MEGSRMGRDVKVRALTAWVFIDNVKRGMVMTSIKMKDMKVCSRIRGGAIVESVLYIYIN